MAEERLPADIFEEMAGVRDITPAPGEVVEGSVNGEVIKTEVNVDRLKEASKNLLLKVPNFGKYLHKLAKKLLSFQKPPKKPKKQKTVIKSVKVVEHESNCASSGKMLPGLWGTVIEVALKAFFWLIKGVIQALLLLGKWAFKLLWNLGKMLIKVFWKIVRASFKILAKLVRWVGKMLFKFIKLIWRGFVALAKAIWNIIRVLFHRLKRKFSKNIKEPPGWKLAPRKMRMHPPPKMDQVGDPKLTGTKVELSNPKPKPLNTKSLAPDRSFKPGKIGVNRESIIWKAFRKAFDLFLKLIGKLVRKIFGGIIQKLIDIVVKIIVRFTIGQIIGSFLPGIGNALALAATAVTAIMLITEGVMFIRDLSRDVTGEESDEGDEMEDVEEEEKEPQKPKKTTYEFLVDMRKMEAEGKQSTAEYQHVKQQYMVGLLKQAEANGNKHEIKMLKAALGIAENKDSSATPSYEAVKNADLSKLQQEFNDNVRKQLYARKEINKREIVGSQEIEEILIGAEGEPDWLVFWRQVMVYVNDKSKDKLRRNRYTWAVRNAAIQVFNGGPMEIPVTYNIEDYTYQIEGRRSIKMVRSKLKWYLALADMLNDLKEKNDQRARILGDEQEVSIWNGALDYMKNSEIVQEALQAKMLAKENATNLMDETRELRAESLDCNWAQLEKLKRFEAIAQVLRRRKA